MTYNVFGGTLSLPQSINLRTLCRYINKFLTFNLTFNSMQRTHKQLVDWSFSAALTSSLELNSVPLASQSDSFSPALFKRHLKIEYTEYGCGAWRLFFIS